MGVVAWARERFARSSAVVRLIQPWRASQPLGPIRDLKWYYQAYYDNVIFRACVDEVATSFAEAPLVARRQLPDGSVENVRATDPLAQLLEDPNREERLSGGAFRQRVAIDLRTSGNAFIRKLYGSRKMVAALWPLRVDLMKIKATPQGDVDHYLYGDGVLATPQRYEPEEVIHLKVPDPCDDFWGLPPAARREVLIDDKMGMFVQSFWERNGIPAMLLKLKAKGVPKKERERIEEQWIERYGVGGSRVAATDADIEVEKIGADFSELRLQDIFGHTETRICAAHGVPAIIAGARIGLVHTQYASYKAARRSFWEETMSPFFRLVSAGLTIGLAREFGRDLFIISDTAKVEAMQESQEDRRQFGLAAWNAGLAKRNEARLLAGWEIDEETPDEYKATAQTGLTGVQMTAMMDVIRRVAQKELPRDTGLKLLEKFGDLEEGEAEAIMGDVGKGFTPELIESGGGAIVLPEENNAAVRPKDKANGKASPLPSATAA